MMVKTYQKNQDLAIGLIFDLAVSARSQLFVQLEHRLCRKSSRFVVLHFSQFVLKIKLNLKIFF